ncbi:ATP-grasp domain-containing protein [Micromonospora lupini]
MAGEVSGTVHFGSFDAEAAWRPEDLAGLPAGPTAGGSRGRRGMDELLAVGCAPGDLLLTAEPMEEALVEALSAAGIAPRVAAVPGPRDDTVEERLASAGGTSLPGMSGWAAAFYAVRPDTSVAVHRLGLRAAVPAVEVVARVNSKVWSNDLVRDAGLPGAAVLATTPGEVRRLAQDTPGDVVLKDPYGVAGRGALRVTTPRMLDTVVRHLERQVARGARVELLVQPLFEEASSFSTHIEVDPSGAMRWWGVQHVDNAEFAYRGSGPLPADQHAILDTSAHREVIARVGTALAAEGYTGPACVDGLRLRDGTLVPVLEVNARRSMGLLNLHLDGRARAVGLRSWLRCRTTPVRPGDTVGRLVSALDDAKLLFRGDGPGVLPLASGTLTPPRGRLFFAVFAPDDATRVALEAQVGDALVATAGAPSLVT